MEERREALRKEFRKVGDEPPSEVDVLDACTFGFSIEFLGSPYAYVCAL